jgi:hypothetical protein
MPAPACRPSGIGLAYSLYHYVVIDRMAFWPEADANV